MPKNKRKKLKINNKIKNKLLILVVLISLIITSIFIIKANKKTVAGKIEDGKVIYSDKILSTTKTKTNKIIEIKSIHKDKLDSIIITSSILAKIKQKDNKYTRTLEEVLKDTTTSNKDIYNINKAIELKIVKKDDSLIMFYRKVTGFKKEKDFIKFCESAFKLMK